MRVTLILATLTAAASGGDFQKMNLHMGMLTRRERDVLQLVVRGHSNRDIGQQLQIAESTVRSHVERMLDKLDMHSRVQLAVWAISTNSRARSFEERSA